MQIFCGEVSGNLVIVYYSPINLIAGRFQVGSVESYYSLWRIG